MQALGGKPVSFGAGQFLAFYLSSGFASSVMIERESRFIHTSSTRSFTTGGNCLSMRRRNGYLSHETASLFAWSLFSEARELYRSAHPKNSKTAERINIRR